MYMKIFHLLKIFTLFTTFIRMIQDMIGDATVFFFILIIVVSGFANAILVFNANRDENEEQVFANNLDN